MSVVIDNSVALAWALPDEVNDEADAVLEQVITQGGHVPFIFRAEFANGLTTATRRGRIDFDARTNALGFLEKLKLDHDTEGTARMGIVVELADQYRLSVYDALYLDLARRKHVSLATFDKKLAGAAREAAIALAVPEA